MKYLHAKLLLKRSHRNCNWICINCAGAKRLSSKHWMVIQTINERFCMYRFYSRLSLSMRQKANANTFFFLLEEWIENVKHSWPNMGWQKNKYLFFYSYLNLYFTTHTHTHDRKMRREGVSRAIEKKKCLNSHWKHFTEFFIRRERKIISRGPLTPVVSESFRILFFSSAPFGSLSESRSLWCCRSVYLFIKHIFITSLICFCRTFFALSFRWFSSFSHKLCET